MSSLSEKMCSSVYLPVIGWSPRLDVPDVYIVSCQLGLASAFFFFKC